MTCDLSDWEETEQGRLLSASDKRDSLLTGGGVTELCDGIGSHYFLLFAPDTAVRCT